MTLPESAFALTEAGYAIFPVWSASAGVCSCERGVHCSAVGKHPKHSNWQQLSKSLDPSIWSPGDNIGLSTDGLAVLDIDADEPDLRLEELIHEFELPDDGYNLFSTGGGGYHLVFAAPPEGVGNGVKVVRDVDLRGDGGLIVAPGSMHKSGREYETVGTLIPRSSLTLLPDRLQRLVRASSATSRVREREGGPGSEWRESEWLEGGRNQRLTQVAGYLRAGGLEESELLPSLLVVNSARCTPPLPEDEVRTIAWSIGRYEPDTVVADVIMGGGAQAELVRASVSDILSLQDMLSMPAPEWLIDGVLPDSDIMMMFGAPGTKKSFLTLDWALAFACGHDNWHGHEMGSLRGDRPGVLYIATEGAFGMGVRAQAWVQQNGADPLNAQFGLYRGAANLMVGEQVDVVRDYVTAHNVGLVVVDTLANSMIGGDENSVTDVNQALDGARRISDAGANVILVHHTNRGGADFRGSSALHGNIDSLLRLRRRGDLTSKLDSYKFKDHPEYEDLVLEFRGVRDSLVIGSAEFENEDGTAATRFLNRIHEEYGTQRFTFADVGAESGGDLRAMIRALSDSGRLAREDSPGAAPEFWVPLPTEGDD